MRRYTKKLFKDVIGILIQAELLSFACMPIVIHFYGRRNSFIGGRTLLTKILMYVMIFALCGVQYYFLEFIVKKPILRKLCLAALSFTCAAKLSFFSAYLRTEDTCIGYGLIHILWNFSLKGFAIHSAAVLAIASALYAGRFFLRKPAVQRRTYAFRRKIKRLLFGEPERNIIMTMRTGERGDITVTKNLDPKIRR